MTKQDLRSFLLKVGFSEPFPTNTMSKLVKLKNGENIYFNVFVDELSYIYFGCDDYKMPFNLLGIDYDGYYSKKQGCESLYPRVKSVHDVEHIFMKLTGESIYGPKNKNGVSYIQFKDETIQVKKLFCCHPLVDRIWQYGGMAQIPTNGDIFRFVCLLLKDGSTHEFKDNGDGKAIEDAEIFLNSLPHEV